MKCFSVHVFFYIVASQIVVKYQANSECWQSCCGPECINVQPININFATVANSQPDFDVVFVPSIPMYGGVDNICWSFFRINQDTYTLFMAEVYCNGLNFTIPYIVTQKLPGVLQFGSTLCNFQGTIFGQLIINEDRCNVILIYLCFLFGDCDLEPEDKTPVVIGLSPSGSKMSPLCVYKVKDLIYRAGFGTQDYNILPIRQPKLCVTKCSNGFSY